MGKNFNEIVHYIRRPVDRRKVEDRRLFLEQEYLENPERRVSMIERRMLWDRRKSLSEVKNTFWKKAL